MYVIIPDQPVTRRQRAHFIVDEYGKELYSSPLLGDCLQWLLERERFTFKIQGHRRDYQFDLVPI